MSRDASVSFAWGDAEQSFRLALGQLRELQEKTDAGPLALFTRLRDGTWRVDDIRETIRLALIGGGRTPAQALSAVARYVDGRPLAESILPAQLILAAALFGPADETPGKAETAEGASEPETSETGFPSPSSMVTEP